ncbi:MAG: aminotransferase class IV [Dehalococcoidia bacterium]|nr:aminotransferase class IV [Dehalococcoidia bacterium]
MSEIIYLNGHLVPHSEARLSPFDHGFLYGYGLFETMRAYNGNIFRLDRHLSRLRCSAESLGLAGKLAASDMEAACLETLRANELKDARLRLTISAGEGDMTPDPDTCSSPTFLVTAKAFIPLSPKRYEQGFKAVLSSLHRDSQSPLSRLKSTCYLNNILARMEAKAAGCNEAIILNERGYLAEGSISNIFLVSKGILITPSLESGILSGITREAVLEIAQALHIKAEEREVELKELTEAEEAFFTNSVLELMPLTWFASKAIGLGKPGQLTKKLMAAYKKLVNETTGGMA